MQYIYILLCSKISCTLHIQFCHKLCYFQTVCALLNNSTKIQLYFSECNKFIKLLDSVWQVWIRRICYKWQRQVQGCRQSGNSQLSTSKYGNDGVRSKAHTFQVRYWCFKSVYFSALLVPVHFFWRVNVFMSLINNCICIPLCWSETWKAVPCRCIFLTIWSVSLTFCLYSCLVPCVAHMTVPQVA